MQPPRASSGLILESLVTVLGRSWTRGSVREVLTNEKYIGNNVYNRRSFKLKKKRVVNTSDMWVRREGAFDPIVSPEDFYTAQGIILARAQRLTDDEMLERLRGLLAKHSLLSSGLIDSAEGVPGSSAYRARFGSLLRAYQLAGYRPDRDYGFLEVNRTLGRLQPTDHTCFNPRPARRPGARPKSLAMPVLLSSTIRVGPAPVGNEARHNRGRVVAGARLPELSPCGRIDHCENSPLH